MHGAPLATPTCSPGGIDNDTENLRDVVSEIAAIELTDGVVFDVERISLVTIREDAKYEGIRVVVPASLGGAVLRLRLDLSFGDPVDPQRIDYPTLLDDAVISLLGYPLENVIAEKAETMMALGDANTRDRDYGDVYLLSRRYPVEGEALRNALQAVAQHRGREIRPLGPLLVTLREGRQQPWAAYRARVGLPELPERYAEVVDAVVEFLDGLQADDGSYWDPHQRRWG
jgi:Nucleotidyl transferase AbiEii toxin, Type IV TA system